VLLAFVVLGLVSLVLNQQIGATEVTTLWHYTNMFIIKKKVTPVKHKPTGSINMPGKLNILLSFTFNVYAAVDGSFVSGNKRVLAPQEVWLGSYSWFTRCLYTKVNLCDWLSSSVTPAYKCNDAVRP